MSQDSRHPYKADPYRAARNPPSPVGYYESPSYNSDAFHSRSPSESSTSRLASSVAGGHAPNNNNNTIISSSEDYYYSQQDPYAPNNRIEKKKKKTNSRQPQPQPHQGQFDKRANSYLPYSNHPRDPYNNEEPIYLQEDNYNSPSNRNTLTTNTQRGPVGSILQDNIVMDMIPNDDFNSPSSNKYQYDENDSVKKEELISPTRKSKRMWITKKLGISGRKLVFIVFGFITIVVIIWYFMWPRTPTLAFLEAGLISNANYSSTNMLATWNVNFTVNNYDNWIPTNINNFAVSVLDSSTGEKFGFGNSGHLMLRPRSIDQIITVPIYINFTRDATNPTIVDLLNACSMINQDLSSPLPKQTLDISFSVIYYIAGIAWNPVSTFSPTSYFQCPMTIT